MTPLRERGAQTVADVWNASAGDKYRIDADLVRLNLFDHPLFHEEASLWWEDTFVAIKRSAVGLYSGPDTKVAHVSLLGGEVFQAQRAEEFPTFPLQVALDTLRGEGYEALVVGQDSGHFLPGAPTDVPWMNRLGAFGFERGGLAFDLERDVSSLQGGAVVSREGSWGTLDESRIDSLEQFLREEFPGRWHYDVMRKVEIEGPRTVFVLLMNDRVVGFALLQEEGCRMPIGGAVWKADLGPQWGALGPIGVAKELRGEGRGSELLNAALCELRDRGARRTIIDWTGLVDYYGAQGFSVNRAYRSYRLSLTAGRPAWA